MRPEQMDFQVELLASCRRQLIEDGLMVLGDSGYECTEKGKLLVQKELRRYQMRPAMMVLIETEIMTLNECSVW
ncbi:ABC transporter ATP-binding protein [Paenibacillus hemerocallicola]|uniref:ABC transporter ATP-binding protein n=1 Tax=Paenibacillus hemerocallicola TaxID=1172614 RepID=A0A5C4THH1_9BACL|nr:ABC transporter ATP-binding protein [Paenibacillus hemerocallicola]TNJ68192.1 ABC transporter ATP-binding protein [Paenibacillus hemerocallicola]